MEKFMKKNTLIKFISLVISELICFEITRFNIFSFQNDTIYISSMNIVQFLYFLPILLITLLFFISTKPDKRLLVNSTIGLILYAIILHIFMAQIASFFTSKQGIVNFTEYSWKIYSICLPFVGFHIFAIKNRNQDFVHSRNCYKI